MPTGYLTSLIPTLLQYYTTYIGYNNIMYYKKCVNCYPKAVILCCTSQKVQNDSGRCRYYYRYPNASTEYYNINGDNLPAATFVNIKNLHHYHNIIY